MSNLSADLAERSAVHESIIKRVETLSACGLSNAVALVPVTHRIPSGHSNRSRACERAISVGHLVQKDLVRWTSADRGDVVGVANGIVVVVVSINIASEQKVVCGTQCDAVRVGIATSKHIGFLKRRKNVH
jgi:hypothetical protein